MPSPVQIVRGDLHVDKGSILLSVPPGAPFLQPFDGLTDAFQQCWEVLSGTNIPDGHAQKLLAGISVVLNGRLVDG